MDCSPPGCSVHGDSPGKNIGVGCHALLQGIFPTQGRTSHVEPVSPAAPSIAGGFFTGEPPGSSGFSGENQKNLLLLLQLEALS